MKINPGSIIGTPLKGQGVSFRQFLYIEKAHQQGVAMTRIGRIKAIGPPSVTMITASGYEQAPYFDRDEVVKIF